jgi:HSP20 family molecular chaperone IbpA
MEPSEIAEIIAKMTFLTDSEAPGDRVYLATRGSRDIFLLNDLLMGDLRPGLRKVGFIGAAVDRFERDGYKLVSLWHFATEPDHRLDFEFALGRKLGRTPVAADSPERARTMASAGCQEGRACEEALRSIEKDLRVAGRCYFDPGSGPCSYLPLPKAIAQVGEQLAEYSREKGEELISGLDSELVNPGRAANIFEKVVELRSRAPERRGPLEDIRDLLERLGLPADQLESELRREMGPFGNPLGSAFDIISISGASEGGEARRAGRPESLDPLAEAYLDGDEVVVVAHLPSLEAGDLRVSARGDLAAIRGPGISKEVRLPREPATEEPSSINYNNGVLEARFPAPR